MDGVERVRRAMKKRHARSSAARSASHAEHPALPSVVVGTLVALIDGRPLVGFDGDPGASVLARSTVELRPADCGSGAVLAFEHGDPARPVVLGLLRPNPARAPVESRPDDVLTLTADRSIVLRCGAASITLTRAGKVLIKGEYVLSRASGANQVKGASVQIN